MYDPSIETSATDFGTAQVLPSSAVKLNWWQWQITVNCYLGHLINLCNKPGHFLGLTIDPIKKFWSTF